MPELDIAGALGGHGGVPIIGAEQLHESLNKMLSEEFVSGIDKHEMYQSIRAAVHATAKQFEKDRVA